ncbi:ATP-dependent rRNA helicase rrp3 [Aspergillus karnatakaensis]|uniref:RNA-dependent ATPase RRP3 n=1 Tax=Aspergillus karnatakaensis TaxID=1810916 RepID=UPI003CCCCCD2
MSAHKKRKTVQKQVQNDNDSDSESVSSHESEQSHQQNGGDAPNNAKSFKELGIIDQLCEACENMGYKAPTPIQSQAIPLALEGRDVIGIAETGSGKTAAFALPILQALMESPQPLFGLIMAPTRELAFQISSAFETLGSTIGVRCCVVVGGMDLTQQAIALAKRPHIIVATPGRLVDHLENTKGFSLRNLRYLVIDEADRLLDMDFGDSLDKILKVLPRERRTNLFSATLGGKVESLTRASLRDPVRVSVSSHTAVVTTLKSYYILLPHKHKNLYLVYLLNEFVGKSVIIFTTTVHETQRVAFMLRTLGFGAIPLHGQLSQSARLGALNKFRSGSRDILVATDVAARGLDIPNVDLVINNDLPMDSKTYIHRVGRTARAGKSGVAISLVDQYSLEIYMRVENALGKKLPEYPIEKDEVMVMAERVAEAQRQATIEMKNFDEKKGSRGKKFGKGKRSRDDQDQEEG